LTYQPFFIEGIEDVEGATRNAYGAMATFLFTFILSVVYLVQDVLRGSRSSGNQGVYDSPSRWRSGNDYEVVPTNMVLGGPNVMQELNTNLDLPLSVERAQFT
jgi:hypothetical protein